MNDNLTQYEIILNQASEIADMFLDMDGGSFFLALICELLQELIVANNFAGATIIIGKLYEVSGVPVTSNAECRVKKDSSWMNLLITAITDLLEME